MTDQKQRMLAIRRTENRAGIIILHIIYNKDQRQTFVLTEKIISSLYNFTSRCHWCRIRVDGPTTTTYIGVLHKHE